MASVKTSISLSPDVAKALKARVKRLRIDQSRFIERAIISQLERSGISGPPRIASERLAKLKDIGALAAARTRVLLREGKVRFDA